jgi:hypothetical protein
LVLADEAHMTVLLSIFATLLAAVIVFAATVVVSGGIAINLIKGYVFPLVVSAFTLAVFAGVLFIRSKNMLPGFKTDAEKDEKTEPSKAGS